jgi:hypothetical protein
MKDFIKDKLAIIFFLGFVIVFFYQFFITHLLPISADTIVGLYHPFRDLYASTNPNGLPFKNFLITDPVRQLYPWKELIIHSFTSFMLPIWNPYEMIGKPLIGNLQGGAFSPFNLLFFIPSFPIAWSFLIISQMVIGGIFFYLFVRHFALDKRVALLGTLAFIFSGFFIVWLEWGNVDTTLLWLPLILLSIDNVLSGIKNYELRIKAKRIFLWSLVFVLSLTFSFFAGHLQIFFYVTIFSFVYFLVRWIQLGKNIKIFILFLILTSLFLLLSSIQWIPTLQFILLSARSTDQSYMSPGFFIPWQHLIQYIAPDFFGNPTTLNYWGVWNYAELVGYIGFLPLVMGVLAIIFRHDKKTYFFTVTVFFGLIFALADPLALLPYTMHIPFISTSQPTRLLSVITFSLAMLAALGSDFLLKKDTRRQRIMFRNIVIIFIPFALVFILLWSYVLFFHTIIFSVSSQNLFVTKHNLVLPTILFLFCFSLLFSYTKINKEHVRNVALLLLLVVTCIDLGRFGLKFESFSNPAYLFPHSKTIQFLKNDTSTFRIGTTDSQILPPNFASHYRIQSIEGYDPLYLLSYGEYVAALERGKPDIHQPFGYNRIITPHNLQTQLFDLLNTKYVLSLSDISLPGYQKVSQEGETRVYKNNNAFPRVFFVQNVLSQNSDQNIIETMFQNNLHNTAVVKAENTILSGKMSTGSAKIQYYSENKVIIQTQNNDDGFLVFSDAYYPTWKATIDGRMTKIYQTDLALRGVFIPKGSHTVIFSDSLF